MQKYVKLNYHYLQKVVREQDISFIALASHLKANPKTISRWYNGKIVNISPSTAKMLSEFLNCPYENLIIQEKKLSFIFSASNDYEISYELLADNHFFDWFRRNGSWQKYISLTKALMEKSEIKENYIQSIYGNLAVCHYFLNYEEEVVEHFINKALLAPKMKQIDYLRVVLFKANYLSRRSKYSEAKVVLDSLPLDLFVPDSIELAQFYCAVSEIEMVIGNVNEIDIKNLQQAFNISLKCESQHTVLWSCYLLAMTYQMKLMKDKSAEFYDKLIQLSIDYKNINFQAEALLHKSILLFENQNYTDAKKCFLANEALPFESELSPNYWRTKSYLALKEQNFQNAKKILQNARKSFKEAPVAQCHFDIWITDLYFYDGQLENYLIQVTEISKKLEKKGLLALKSSLNELAETRLGIAKN